MSFAKLKVNIDLQYNTQYSLQHVQCKNVDRNDRKKLMEIQRNRQHYETMEPS